MTTIAETAETITADVCMAELTEWATERPGARFVAVVIAPDGTDGVGLGWGLALPDHAFVYLPTIGVSGCFRSAGSLLDKLRRTMDARLIWIDPEPAALPGDPDDDDAATR